MLTVTDREYKATGKLTFCEMDEPDIEDNEVLIEVKAIGVNRPDILQKKGFYSPPEWASKILGLECSGTIEKIGKKVLQFKKGDRVCALTSGGSYAEKVAAHEGHCFLLPNNLSFSEGCILPEAYMTCWLNISEKGLLKEKNIILIHGGSSGIGSAAIQISKWIGAKVVTTVRDNSKKIFCERLGSDLVINSREDDFCNKTLSYYPDGVDLVLDMIGGNFTEKNICCLKQNGRLIQIAFLGGQYPQINLMEVMKKQIVITGSLLRSQTDNEKKRIARLITMHIWDHITKKSFKSCLYKEFDFAEVNEAHQLMENFKHVGKIALKV